MPPLNNTHDGKKFDKWPNFQLVDENGNTIVIKRDRLITSQSVDLEKAMIAYNRTGHIASVPRFAQPQTTTRISSLPADLAYHDAPAERLLELWYHQVDAATRQRLVLWMKALRTS